MPEAPTIAPDGRVIYATAAELRRIPRRRAPIVCAVPDRYQPETWAPPAFTITRPTSGNKKTGRIPVTARPQLTCPRSCPLYGNGCYAENRGSMGRPSPFDQASAAAAAHAAGTAKRRPLAVRELATRRWRKTPPAVRFNVSGDYLTAWNGAAAVDYAYIDETNAVADALAPRGTVLWGFTHAWRDLEPDLFRYTVRASANNPDDAAEAMAAGWTVAMVDPGPGDPATAIGATIAGRRVVQCPATLPGSARTCADCRLCGLPAVSDAAARLIVAFPVHGARRARARRAIAR